MTEVEWLDCTDPILLLNLLKTKASKRKLRLFIADGVKKLASIFGMAQEELSEFHERVAEERATEEDLERFLFRDMPELWEHRVPGGNLESVWDTARMVVRDRFKLAPLKMSDRITLENRIAENSDMCSTLRCIFGYPFHSAAIDSFWLSWHENTIPKIAQAIYDGRAFDYLPILADALEEAGCANADILNHCRQPSEHVRGCWVVDLILGKH